MNFRKERKIQSEEALNRLSNIQTLFFMHRQINIVVTDIRFSFHMYLILWLTQFLDQSRNSVRYMHILQNVAPPPTTARGQMKELSSLCTAKLVYGVKARF